MQTGFCTCRFKTNRPIHCVRLYINLGPSQMKHVTYYLDKSEIVKKSLYEDPFKNESCRSIETESNLKVITIS